MWHRVLSEHDDLYSIGKKRNVKKRIFNHLPLFMILCCNVVAGLFSIYAQSPVQDTWKELGQPMRETFTRKDYQAHGQTWAIVQDSRGFIYIGNGGGLLEYDGSNWGHIQFPGGGGAFGLAVDPDGRIFVGGTNEMGYLAPGPDGTMDYVSLTERTPQAARQPVMIMKVVTVGQRVYFYGRLPSGSLIFEWQGGSLETAAPEDSLSFWQIEHSVNMFGVEDQLYAGSNNWGLHRLEHGEWIPEEHLPKAVQFIAPWHDQEEKNPLLLLGHLPAGESDGELSFFSLVKPGTSQVQPFPVSATVSSELAQNSLKGGSLLKGNHLALSLQGKGGGMVMDSEGNCLQGLSTDRGLVNQSIRQFKEDRHGGLWVSTDDGVSRLEVQSPLSFFPPESGFEGTAYFFCKHRDQAFLGTTVVRLYRMVPPESPDQLASFQQIDGLDVGLCRLPVGDQLLVGARDGVYLVNGNSASRLGPGSTQCSHPVSAIGTPGYRLCFL